MWTDFFLFFKKGLVVVLQLPRDDSNLSIIDEISYQLDRVLIVIVDRFIVNNSSMRSGAVFSKMI